MLDAALEVGLDLGRGDEQIGRIAPQSSHRCVDLVGRHEVRREAGYVLQPEAEVLVDRGILEPPSQVLGSRAVRRKEIGRRGEPYLRERLKELRIVSDALLCT